MSAHINQMFNPLKDHCTMVYKSINQFLTEIESKYVLKEN